MGRRSRRRRVKAKKRSERRSDPEHFNSRRRYRDNKEIIDDERSGWDSLDERTLLDYMDNVTKYDEMEVTQKLSGLNVSAFIEQPEVVTSDVDTIYSELPSATILDSSCHGNVERRYCRKRFSKRNRKRTKKLKTLSLEHQQVVDYLFKKHKKPRNFIKESSLIVDDGQSVIMNDKVKVSDTSSRGLTDSDSPIIDDIVMLESSNESVEGLTMIEDDQTLMKENIVKSNSDSELIESTTSDSGCEGDDEESSVEISGCLKLNNNTKTLNYWWNDQSSADDDDDDAHFQKILNGSFPFLSPKGQKDLAWKMNTADDGELFKNPQLCGIQGHRGKFRKKPESCTIATPQDLWQRIDEFIRHETEVELHLPMLSRALCRTASKLAQIYCLECTIQQRRRLPVAAPLLTKTSLTCLASRTEVEAILKSYQRELQTSPVLWTKRAQKHPRVLPVHVPVSALCYKTESMTVVGGDAPPIEDCNVGNQILRNMGWKPGNGLGADENGIRNPILASRRPKFAGLGYKK